MNLEFLPSLNSLPFTPEPQVPLLHRDLSWLQFNERVLEEARFAENPLLEKVKFLAISATNLDEFFMIRVASLARSIGQNKRKLDLLEANRLSDVFSSILESVSHFETKQLETLRALTKELQPHGVHIVERIEGGTPAFQLARSLFEEHVLPKLPQPESFSINSLSLLENLQLGAILPRGLWIRIPRNIPPMIWSLSEDKKGVYFFFLDDLLANFLGPSVPEEWKPGFVRLTRDGDFPLDLEDADPETIPDVVRTKLGTRERGRPIRLQYSPELGFDFLEQARYTLKLSRTQLFPGKATLCFHGLWSVVNQIPEQLTNAKEIKYATLQSKIPHFFSGEGSLFDRIRQRDYLLHHPYDSFEAFVQFMREATLDPAVISIEQTVYRMDTLSPVIDLLKDAAKRKRVRVVIELRARFDELNNLRLTDELRKAGVEVAFGFGTLKLHAKVALITRLEGGTPVLYTHLSTGNYNAATARQYTDLAVITCHQEIGADARHFFDCIYRGEIPQSFKHLVIAPTRLARRLQAHIREEIEAARAGENARIIAKVNALVDEGIIKSLYQASQAGVQVDSIVRGACSLVPQIKGLSENIRVVSIVDRFLEHSRIYYFEHAKRMYLSSADWMPRNFFSRLEIAFPVLDPRLYSYLKDIVLPAYLSDTVKARELNQNGTWNRPKHSPNKIMRSQVFFRELALRDYKGTPLE